MSQPESHPADHRASQYQHRAAATPPSDEGLFDLFAIDADEGVALDSLAPGTVLAVTTRNTCYRLVLLNNDGQALVSGGARFPDPTEVRIEGSTAGGHALRLGWIGVGLRLEMRMGARTITTSTVQSIEPIAA
jgi:hypothetical protein